MGYKNNIFKEGLLTGIGKKPTTEVLEVGGNLDLTSGFTYKIGGLDINTKGTLSNVAYLNQANTFTEDNYFSKNVIIGASNQEESLDVFGEVIFNGSNLEKGFIKLRFDNVRMPETGSFTLFESNEQVVLYDGSISLNNPKAILRYSINESSGLPFGNMTLSGLKNEITLKALSATDGASQINSRLQIGYDQFEPNNSNPYILSVNGDSQILGDLNTTGDGLFSGTITALDGNSTNWNTAYGWGNHAGLYSLLNHTHTFASLTSKPTTLSGYGITDTYTKTEVNSGLNIAYKDEANIFTATNTFRAEDAYLNIESTEAGNWGTAIILKERTALGVYNDNWLLARKTSGAGSDFCLMYGTGNSSVTNATSVFTLTKTGTATFASSLSASNLSGTNTGDQDLSGYIDGSGTTNYIPKFTASGTLGNSPIYTDGTNIGIGTTSPSEKLVVSSDSNFYSSIRGEGSIKFGLKLQSGITDVVDFSYNATTGENKIGGLQSYVYSTFYSGGSERMRITAGGNVGIGTTEPKANLEVVGNAIIKAKTDNSDILRINQFDNDYRSFQIGMSGVSGSLVDFSCRYNNIIIPSFSITRATGDVEFSGSITSTGSLAGTRTGLYLSNTSTNSIAHSRLRIQTASAAAGDPYLNFGINGVLDWTVGIDNSDGDKFKINSGSSSGPSNGTTQLSIDLDGNGRFSGDLQVQNNLYIGDQMKLGKYTGDDARLGHINNITFFDNFLGGFEFRTTSNYLRRMVILNNGNVGIGTTSPSYKLHIKETSANAKMYINGENASNSSSLLIGRDARNWEVKADTAANLYTLSVSYIGTDEPVSNILTLTKDGNVGIGTTEPKSSLHVGGALDNIVSIGTTDNGGNNNQALGAITTSQVGGLGNLHFQTNGWNQYPSGVYDPTTKMTILGNGNVGIGTTSPTEKLEVVGNGTFSGNITAASFLESSLRELKTNIKPFNKSGLDLVNELNIVEYNKKDNLDVDKVGIIIDESPNEFANKEQTAVDLYKTIFVQAKAIQELSERLEKLEKLLTNG